MTSLEKLEQIALDENIDVISYDFTGTRISGMYCDGTIALSKGLKTSAERACVLAEELGHHYTSHGDIIDITDVSNRKQEYRARLYAYDLQVGLLGIIQAFEAGCQNRYEMAEFLGTSEEFLAEALECYRSKYSPCVSIDNYVIFFEPCLGIMKKWE